MDPTELLLLFNAIALCTSTAVYTRLSQLCVIYSHLCGPQLLLRQSSWQCCTLTQQMVPCRTNAAKKTSSSHKSPTHHKGSARTTSAEAQGASHADPAKASQFELFWPALDYSLQQNPYLIHESTKQARQHSAGRIFKTAPVFSCWNTPRHEQQPGKARHRHHTGMQQKLQLHTETDIQSPQSQLKGIQSTVCRKLAPKSGHKPPSAYAALMGD